MAHLRIKPCENLRLQRHILPKPSLDCVRRRVRRSSTLCCYSQHKLLLYTKPDCPLCDGLQDKIRGLIDRAEFMPSFLTGIVLEIRDISTNEDWQDAMHLSVPVLAVLDAGGREVVLPRPQPRMTADRLQRHLQEALAAVDADV